MNAYPYIPLNAIQAWCFDLDGTLMDTDDQAVESLAHRMRFFGARRAQRLARRIVMLSETPMNNLLTLLDCVGLDAPLFALQKLLGKQTQPTFRIITGVQALLARLASRARLAVVSTRSATSAQAFLEQHAISHYFDLVITRETTWRLKPHPAPLLYTIAQLGVPPEACAMVGDTPVDMVSARRAGVWAVGVLCGFGEQAELRRAGAHLVLPSTADLLPLLRAN